MLTLDGRHRLPRPVVAVVLLLSFSLAHAAGLGNKHDFGCAKCHSTHQPHGSRLFAQEAPKQTRSGTQLFGSDPMCYSCHQKEADQHLFEGGFSHPTSIPVKRAQVSSKLPLTRVRGLGDVITCSSCHDPHIKTPYMLRIPTTNDQLCVACHRFE